MLEKFKEFEIKNTKVVFGGNSNSRDHGDNLGVPNDNTKRSMFTINILMD